MPIFTHRLPVVLFFAASFGFTCAQNYSALILGPLDGHAYSGAEAAMGFTSTNHPLANIVARLDLQQAFCFTRAAAEHSAQFNRPIQRQMIEFYGAINEAASPVSNP